MTNGPDPDLRRRFEDLSRRWWPVIEDLVDEIVDSAIFETFESLPRGKRRDADAVSSAIERAVRNAVNAAWGKKPAVHVLVVEV